MPGKFKTHLRSVFRELFLGLLVFIVLSIFVPVPHDSNLLFNVIHHAAVLVIALAMPMILKIFRHRELIVAILDMLERDASQASGPVRMYAQHGIENLGNRIDSLQRYPGIELGSEEELRDFSRACFRYARGCYYGVDTHWPSEFLKRYRGFLEEHEDGIRPTAAPSARILAVDRERLRNDLTQHPGEFGNFYDWHRDNGILLLQVDPARTVELVELTGVKAVDVGLWVGDYAVVFWIPAKESAGSALKIQFLARHDAGYREALSYIRWVNRSSAEVRLSEGVLSFRSRDDREITSIEQCVV